MATDKPNNTAGHKAAEKIEQERQADLERQKKNLAEQRQATERAAERQAEHERDERQAERERVDHDRAAQERVEPPKSALRPGMAAPDPDDDTWPRRDPRDAYDWPHNPDRRYGDDSPAARRRAAIEAQALDPAEGDALLSALSAIDHQITDQNGGEHGTGVYQLLQLLARQFLGMPAPAVPWTPTPPAEA